jgi:hypothetical protein
VAAVCDAKMVLSFLMTLSKTKALQQPCNGEMKRKQFTLTNNHLFLSRPLFIASSFLHHASELICQLECRPFAYI